MPILRRRRIAAALAALPAFAMAGSAVAQSTWPAKPVRVLAVKGSGGDLGTIGNAGFAVLDLERLLQLREHYQGEAGRVLAGVALIAGNAQTAGGIDGQG